MRFWAEFNQVRQRFWLIGALFALVLSLHSPVEADELPNPVATGESPSPSPLRASAAEKRSGQGSDGPGSDPASAEREHDANGQIGGSEQNSSSDSAIRLPELEEFVAAPYPTEAKNQGLQAVVVLALTVDRSGQVSDATVVEAAGHGFDEAAVAAAFQFKFSPATRLGVPVSARILYRYRFELDDITADTSERLSADATLTSALRGRVRMGSEGMPVAGASVEILSSDGSRYRVVTAEDGSFEMAGLQPGRCHLLVQSEGLSTVVRDLALLPGKVATFEAELQVAVAEDDAINVNITAEREPALTERSYSRRELKSMPGTLGDAMRALQNMPGVAVAPMGSADLVVRGMGPRANLVYVDGLLVLNAYHLWGISSVVPTEMLETLEFYPGNYGVEYGRGLGGMIELKTRRAAATGQYHGLAQIDMIDSRVMLEGPVPGLDGWSFIGGARRSHLDKTLMPVLGFDVTPVYHDYQLFLETRPSRRSRLRIGIFGSKDRLTFGDGFDAAQLRSSYEFWYLTSRYDAQITDELFWEHSLAFGYLRNSFTLELPGGAISADAPAYPLALRSSLAWQAIDELSLRVGTDLHYAPFEATLTLPPLQESDAQPSGGQITGPMVRVDAHDLYFRPAAFVEATLAPTPRSRIIAGVRADWSHDIDAWDTSPRLRGSYTLGKSGMQTKLKAGVGLFHQPPQPEEVLPGFGSQKLRSSRALQTSLGVEQRLFDAMDANLEGYYYRLTKLVERAVGPSGDVNFVNQGDGYTYGLESLLRYDDPDSDFYGWLAYTLSRSMRRASESESRVLTNWDQTHIMTLLGSYRLGGGWEFGARFQLMSGMPYTPVVKSLYSSTSDQYVPVLGGSNSRRYPAFHQLDLRAEKFWQIDWVKLTAYLDILNVYANRRVIEIQYNDDYSESTYFKFPLPMVPSLGLRGEF